MKQTLSMDLETTEKTVLVDLTCAQDFMKIAIEEAIESPDPRTQCGACIVAFNIAKEPIIVGRGFNTFHHGVKHRLDRPEKYDYIEHAERMAISNMFKGIKAGNVRIYPSTELAIFSPWLPCGPCANAIVGHNINYYVHCTGAEDETGGYWEKSCSAGYHILQEAGVSIFELERTNFGIKVRRDEKEVLY